MDSFNVNKMFDRGYHEYNLKLLYNALNAQELEQYNPSNGKMELNPEFKRIWNAIKKCRNKIQETY